MKLKNPALKKKLRNYSMLAGAVLTAGSTDAQVIYHNINPEKVLNVTGQQYKLDLNGNGVPDFTFQEYQSNFYEAEIYPEFATPGHSYNAIGGSVKMAGTNKFGFPRVYAAGQVIGPKISWFSIADLKNNKNKIYNPAMGYVNGTFKAGHWLGATRQFLALKVVVKSAVSHFDSLTYYGWARCSVSLDARTLTIYDYAYQSVSDSSVIAGDTGSVTGISLQPLLDVSIYASGKNVFVKYPGGHTGIVIRVTDMSGKVIREFQTSNEFYELNLDDAASGVYSVSVISKNAGFTKKVSIQ